MAEETSLMVRAFDGMQSIRSIDEDGNLLQLGHIRYRDYEENRSLRVPFFIDEAGKEHRLGSATGQFRMLDHYTVLEPLLSAGYTPRMVHHSRGGVDLFAVMERKDLTFPDPITWDRDQYPDALDDGQLTFAIGIRSSLRVGKGFLLTGGYFRVVCVNGLVAAILGLGKQKLTHRTISQTAISAFATLSAGRAENRDLPSFSSKGVGWTRKVLTGYFAADDEAKAVGLERLPDFIKPSLRSLDRRLPAWAQAQLQHQLEIAASAKNALDALDILNILTNLANGAPRGVGPSFRIYRYLDPTSSALVRLLQLGDLVADPSSLFRVEIS